MIRLGVNLDHVATLKYGNQVKVGRELAKELIAVAKRSVGAHHGETYRREVKFVCRDLESLREQLATLKHDIDAFMKQHEVGQLLVTIPGNRPADRGATDRRGRRLRPLRDPRPARQLRRRGASATPLGEEDAGLGVHLAYRQRQVAAGLVHAEAECRA